jgi:hypothetical protein
MAFRPSGRITNPSYATTDILRLFRQRRGDAHKRTLAWRRLDLSTAADGFGPLGHADDAQMPTPRQINPVFRDAAKSGRERGYSLRKDAECPL